MNNFLKILLISIFILPLLSLITPGLPVTHDGQDHVARIANFYQSLSEGNLIPRWGSNLNWGFGHPVLMFLYPLSSYIASFFHVLGFSLIDSIKLVFVTTYLASIYLMYIFIKEKWGNSSALVAAFIYGFTPYRFVNIYVRGALGEHTAFVFLPLILLCLYKIAKLQKLYFWDLCLSLSLAGLMLAHNAVSLMMLPVIMLYIFYLFVYEVKDKKIFLVRIFIFTLLGLGLAAFFIIPAFFEGKYTLRDIVTKGQITDRFVDFKSFLFSSWNYGGGNEFTKELGYPVIISIFGLIYIVRKKIEHKFKVLLFTTLILFALCVIAMTHISAPIWNSISILQKFQFPWRLLVMTTFLGSILGALLAYFINGIYKKIFVFVLIVISIATTLQMWKPKEYRIYNESFFKGIYLSTTDTGESSPIWSTRFMEYVPDKPIYVVEGEAKIVQVNKNTTLREYEINSTKSSKIVENTLYFPGWKVYIDGIESAIEFQNQNYRGLMSFHLDPGIHKVKIVFGDTKLRYIAKVITLITLLMFLIISVYIIRSNRKVKKYHKK